MKTKTILAIFGIVALCASPIMAVGLGGGGRLNTNKTYTFTQTQVAPSWTTSSLDGYHFFLPYNSVAFAGTPSIGMIQTTPTGPQWYTGTAWEAIGGASAIADLTDWPSGLTATELGYLDGATSNIQAQINAISVGSPVTTAPTYSDQTCTAGQYAFDSGYAYFCRTANTWDRIALGGWSNPAPVAPTFSSAILGTDGTTLTLGMSASTSVGAGGSGGIVATGSTSGALSGTYSSGAPGTSLVYTLPSSIKSGETVTLAYAQPGNGLEGTTGGADVVTVSGTSVTNNSTQSGGVVYSDNFDRADQNPLVDGDNASSTPTGTWSHAPTTQSLKIVSSHALASSDMAMGYFSGGSFADNQYSKINIVTNGNNGIGPAVRVSASSNTGYFVMITSSTTIRIDKYLAGTHTVVGSAFTMSEWTDNDTVELDVTGSATTTLTVKRNGTVIGTVDDTSSPILSGSAGIYIDSAASPSPVADNWEGGNL